MGTSRRLRRHHDGPRRGGPVSRAERCPARGGAHVREVARREPDERRRRRRPIRPSDGRDHEGRRRRLRRLRPRGAPWLRRRRSVRRHGSGAPDADRVLRAPAAGVPDDPVLPAAERAGHAGLGRRARRRRDPGRADPLDDGDRALGGAEPDGHPGRPRGARPGSDHRARPRLPADVLVDPGRRASAAAPCTGARDGRRGQRRGMRRRGGGRIARGPRAAAARPRAGARDREARGRRRPGGVGGRVPSGSRRCPSPS